MKKNYTIICLFLLMCITVAAQTTTTTTTTTTGTATAGASDKNEKFYSKRGVYFFPEAGEFALGIDAVPFLRYAGSLMALNNNNTPYVSTGANPNGTIAIYGKYFLTDQKAIRIRLGLTDIKKTTLYPVVLSSLTPDPLAPSYGNDKTEQLNTGFYLALGLEKRRGKGRIQGVYGAEVIVGYYQNLTNYIYANSINANFNQPETYFNNYSNGQRVIKDRTQQIFYAGARVFAGVEYFFAPKISLGGEFGYSYMVQTSGVGQETREYWDGSSTSVKKITNDYHSNDIKVNGLDMDALNGAINLFFYF